MADTAEFVINLEGDASKEALRLARHMEKVSKAEKAAAKQAGVTATKIRAATRQVSSARARAHREELRRQKKEQLAQRKKRAGAGMITGGGFAMAGAVAAAGVAAGAGAAVATINRVAHTERLTSMFDRLNGQGTATFEKLRKLSLGLGVDIDQTAKSYGTFLKLQFKPAEAEKMIKLGADMQALGSSADDVQGIYRALGQIKSKGRLSAEELGQLEERGISRQLVHEAIAKKRGLGQGPEAMAKVLKLQAAGEISADEFAVAFEKAANKKLNQAEAGESAKNFAQTTITGFQNRMKGQAKSLWIDFAANAEPGIRKAQPAVERLMATLSDMSKDPKVVSIMTRLGTAIGDFADNIATLLPVALELGSVFLGSLAEGYSLVNGEAATGSTATMSLVEAMRTAKPMIATLATGVGLLAAAFETAFSWGNKLIGTMLTVAKWTPHGMMFQAGAAIGKQLGLGVTLGMDETGPMVSEAGARMASRANHGLQNEADINSPSRVMAENGRFMSQGLSQGMTQSAPDGSEMLGSFKANMMPAGAKGVGGGGGVNVGGITIEVSGSGDPEETAQAALRAFESNMGAIFNRYSGEAAA